MDTIIDQVDYCFFAVYLAELVLRFAVYGIMVLSSHWTLGPMVRSRSGKVKRIMFCEKTSQVSLFSKAILSQGEV